jgi:hypothetical protein
MTMILIIMMIREKIFQEKILITLYIRKYEENKILSRNLRTVCLYPYFLQDFFHFQRFETKNSL